MKRRKIKKGCIITFLFILIIFGIVVYILCNKMNLFKKTSNMFLASDNSISVIYGINEDKSVNLDNKTDAVRGSSIIVYDNRTFEDYIVCIYQNKEYYCNKKYLVDSLEKTVLEKELYVRTSYNLKENVNDTKLLGLAKKGDKVDIIGFDKLDSDGNVNMYKINYNNEVGYFYNKYLVNNYEDSIKNYDEDNTYKIHKARTDKQGLLGGEAGSLDYYPVSKPKFSNNNMPENVYALYITGAYNVLNNIDEYISFAKKTNINAFVVDIKDDGLASYPSSVYENISPTSISKSQVSKTTYKSVIDKIKNNGFYVIGRITTFKDTYLIKDKPEYAISDNNGNKLDHRSSYWPTAYNRDVWKYNVDLAIEAVKEFGFNEIQFDYCRFPDGLIIKQEKGLVNFHNEYNETKAQAIQRFLMYATNEIHNVGAYVSVDVFGESANNYVTAYGQYYAAMSNVVDVISAMPYTDHFGEAASFWENPYRTLYDWSKKAKNHRDSVATPAIDRTWITAYNVPYWDPYIDCDGEYISKQVEGIYDAGLVGGYMTWNASSSLTLYRNQVDGFKRDYGNE